jgi:hypothetical protein
MNPDYLKNLQNDNLAKYFHDKYIRATFIPEKYLQRKDEDILEEMDIKTIEQFLRKKKLENLNKNG